MPIFNKHVPAMHVLTWKIFESVGWLLKLFGVIWCNLKVFSDIWKNLTQK